MPLIEIFIEPIRLMNFVTDRAVNDLRELHGRMNDGIGHAQLEHYHNRGTVVGFELNRPFTAPSTG